MVTDDRSCHRTATAAVDGTGRRHCSTAGECAATAAFDGTGRAATATVHGLVVVGIGRAATAAGDGTARAATATDTATTGEVRTARLNPNSMGRLLE